MAGRVTAHTAARAAGSTAWAPQTRAARSASARPGRGRPFTFDQTARLADADYDLQTWAVRARVLLTFPNVTTHSLADAADIAAPPSASVCGVAGALVVLPSPSTEG